MGGWQWADPGPNLLLLLGGFQQQDAGDGCDRHVGKEQLPGGPVHKSYEGRCVAYHVGRVVT